MKGGIQVRRLPIISLISSLFLFPLFASAQLTESTLKGVAADTSGSVVERASVIATNESTGVSRATATADNGSFLITDLPPGSYTLEVKTQGYKTAQQTHIQLSVGTTTEINVRLEVGQAQETVEVTADQSQIQVSTDGRLSDTLQKAQITELRFLPVAAMTRLAECHGARQSATFA